jgi:hypothetical protein
MADPTRHAAGLIVNTLALAKGEATDSWMLRHGLEAALVSCHWVVVFLAD